MVTALAFSNEILGCPEIFSKSNAGIIAAI
jgi:hypothetical protein